MLEILDIGMGDLKYIGVNLTINRRLETASTQTKPTSVGLITLILH
ncbi:MAG: hypothetical protein KME23_21945 [Goleter apudmare HA4340-LM2]|jgi:hypothetical protein|nr:hypothetical protein [Goleter apudmare HA4340-LM2]